MELRQSLEVADVPARGFVGPFTYSACTDQAVASQGRDIRAIRIAEPADLADREIERGQQPHLDHLRVYPGQGERQGVVVGVRMEEPEGVVVLPVEVEEPGREVSGR